MRSIISIGLVDGRVLLADLGHRSRIPFNYFTCRFFLMIYYNSKFSKMVKRCDRSNDGFYHMHGKKYEMLEGSRAQVWHDTAYKTPGGLTRSELVFNKHGRIVSAKKHATAKKENRLRKYGYTARKGKFGAIKINSKTGKRSRLVKTPSRSR